MSNLSPLNGKRIVLGVTGGIAAYKAAEIVRMLCAAGSEVRVVMTRSATAFIAPLTFQALSGNPVHQDLLNPAEESAMGHIELARWANLVLIAPATADFMARLRCGLAGDLLTALCLATTAPVVLAPAMNHRMWANPATQDNRQILERRGIGFLGPESGEQACGETGPGRLMEPPSLLAGLAELMASNGLLSGVSVLITAGPTREPIDPVRYISNRSSGKMGYALASAARDMGARVTLVSGPVALESPAGVETRQVETAREMYDLGLALAASHDLYIGAAAIADYTPETQSLAKIKKTSDQLSLRLQRTNDLLFAIAAMGKRPFTVGFAAETHDLETYARDKLKRKKLDMVAANLVGGEAGGFDREENEILLLWNGGETRLRMNSKRKIAEELLRIVAERYRAGRSAV